MNLRRQSNGQNIIIDPSLELGSGGEARIYRLPNEQSLVAKIYHEFDRDRAKKLIVMVGNPPDDPMKDVGEIMIAWPIDLLLNSQKQVAGFLMPRIEKMREIIKFYNPKTRLKECPSFNYYYLHHAAMNLATAVYAIHKRGYVIADVNESNILVSESALVTIIDTDSFQVFDQANKTIYRCAVGKPEYAPPEIQKELDDKREYRYFNRSIESDNFALAVLIFRLLMEGQHPFDGMYIGKGDSPLHPERIKSGHFPHSLNSHGPYRPVKNAPSFEILHPELQKLFIRCFDDGHKDPKSRPGAREWREALEEVEKELATCSTND
jgi:DNA-binding helix-hairpin-helix protein with protein kinase domain